MQLIAVVSNDGTTRQSVTDSRLGPYVIMEYLQNGTLMSFLEDIQGSEPLPHAFILSVFLCSEYRQYMRSYILKHNDDLIPASGSRLSRYGL